MPSTIPNRLTDAQVERLTVAIESLQQHNISARVIDASLKKCATLDDRRKVLVTAFSQSYEVLLVMQMALDSDMDPQSVKDALEQHARPE